MGADLSQREFTLPCLPADSDRHQCPEQSLERWRVSARTRRELARRSRPLSESIGDSQLRRSMDYRSNAVGDDQVEKRYRRGIGPAHWH